MLLGFPRCLTFGFLRTIADTLPKPNNCYNNLCCFFPFLLGFSNIHEPDMLNGPFGPTILRGLKQPTEGSITISCPFGWIMNDDSSAIKTAKDPKKISRALNMRRFSSVHISPEFIFSHSFRQNFGSKSLWSCNELPQLSTHQLQ